MYQILDTAQHNDQEIYIDTYTMEVLSNENEKNNNKQRFERASEKKT